MKNANKIKKIILRILLLILAAGILFILLGIQASRRIEINSYTLTADIQNPLRIVQITDLHNAELGPGNADLIEAIRSQKPDLIFMTGDMINRDDSDISVICSLIENLQAIAPVYYGYGNHEVSWEADFGDRLRNELESCGAIVLQDSFTDVSLKGNMLRIGGCMGYYHAWGMTTDDSDMWKYEEAFAKSFEATDRCKLLLDHIPTSFTDWDHRDDYPVDFVFSGHYHGGMIRIPIIDRGVYAPYIGFFPPYTKGVTEGKIATCIQSAGMGTEHAIPRMFNPPEVTVIELMPGA